MVKTIVAALRSLGEKIEQSHVPDAAPPRVNYLLQTLRKLLAHLAVRLKIKQSMI